MFDLFVYLAAGAITVSAHATGPWATLAECEAAAQTTRAYASIFVTTVRTECRPNTAPEPGKPFWLGK